MNSHPSCVDGGIASTSFMQAGKRAPILISALDEGPNMGFTVGFWTDWETFHIHGPANLTHLERNWSTLCSRVHNQLIDKHADHRNGQNPY
jgi:hypothetical protein